MRIAVDAMGGDRGPEVVGQAAVAAAKSDPSGLHILLVGDRARVEAALDRSGGCPSNVEIVHASESIEMSEAPAVAVRKKKDSSIAVALRLVKEREAEALVSAGNTGAVVAGSLVVLGRLHGVSRPAITAFYPSRRNWVVFLDVGANSECTPKNFLQFGIMGAVCSEYLVQVAKPRIGLLNIGEESSKGTAVVRAAHQLMLESEVNFVGNVEGRDVFAGKVEVVVCDGFVGNVVLKFSESILSFTSHVVRQEIKKRPLAILGAVLMKPAFSAFRSKLDYAEYGGAPLLGVNGVVIIGHGKSSPRAITNAIRMAQRFVRYGVNDHIEERFKGSTGDIATCG